MSKFTILPLTVFLKIRASHIKKGLIATERGRVKVREQRREWKEKRQPWMREEPPRLVFIDETSVKTNMTRLRGRCSLGERLFGTVPFGRRGTQTFIAGLSCCELIAPWIIDRAINREIFDCYIETQFLPELEPGTVVILDNLSVHKSKKAAQLLKEKGCWFLFLPPYSPDLNPIEMAFSKLKAHLRRIGARTFDELSDALAEICDLFTPEECWNFFKGAEYTHD